MKPALSPATTAVLPTFVTSASRSASTAGSVTTVRMISTRPITGAGLNQWVPTTRDGRDVPVASSVIDSELVFVAIIVPDGHSASNSARTARLSSIRSGTASTTSPQPATADNSVPAWIRPKSASRSASVNLPRLTARSVEWRMWPSPLASVSSLSSTPTTSMPARARTSAIPAPMVPSPTTPTLVKSWAMPTTPLVAVSVPTSGARDTLKSLAHKRTIAIRRGIHEKPHNDVNLMLSQRH